VLAILPRMSQVWARKPRVNNSPEERLIHIN
jgi:hypothetical protein